MGTNVNKTISKRSGNEMSGLFSKAVFCTLTPRPVLVSRNISVNCAKRVMWPTGFRDPIKHKKEFPETKESGVFDETALNPVKAAPNEATCSLFKTSDKIRKFTRLIMMNFDRHRADLELRDAFRLIKKAQLAKYWKAPEGKRREAIQTDPQVLLLQAIENARPLMAISTAKVGAMNYTVPTPITVTRSEFEGMRWILTAARDRDRSKSRFHEKLAEVIIDTAAYQGRVISIKDEHHKICEINRAFAHYRRSK